MAECHERVIGRGHVTKDPVGCWMPCRRPRHTEKLTVGSLPNEARAPLATYQLVQRQIQMLAEGTITKAPPHACGADVPSP
jgi:hypothetical protein